MRLMGVGMNCRCVPAFNLTVPPRNHNSFGPVSPPPGGLTGPSAGSAQQRTVHAFVIDHTIGTCRQQRLDDAAMHPLW